MCVLQGAWAAEPGQQLTPALETLEAEKGSSLFNTLLYDNTAKAQRLMELQEELGRRLDPPCDLNNLTVNETVRKRVEANREDFASKVKEEMGMTDERYIWVGISAMAAKGKFLIIGALSCDADHSICRYCRRMGKD